MRHAGPQREDAADRRAGGEHAPVALHRIEQGAVVGVERAGVVHPGGVMAVDDHRELRLVEEVEVGRLTYGIGEQACEAQVVLDRGDERVRAIGLEGHPRTEAAERVRHLDALPDGPDRAGERSVADVLEILGLAREGGRECAGIAHEDAADGLRQVEPLVRVDRERVDAVEAREQRGARRRGRRGRAVGAVDVQPDAVPGADVGKRAERIDGTGARRARDADHGDRGDACREIGLDRTCELVGTDAKALVTADGPQRTPPESEQVACAGDRVVRLLGGIDGGRAGRDTVLARGGKRVLPRACQAGHVGERAAAREVTARRREADQLGQPAPRHVLDHRGQAGAAAEVGIERGCEHRRGDARLEAGAIDERERARMRVRVRARQHLAGDVLDRRLETLAGAWHRHAIGRALLVGQRAGRGQVADVAAEGGGTLARQRDRARGLLGRAEARSFAGAIGVPPCARMRDAKIAALRAPPIAMQPTGTPGGI